jgi:hypothetical protein
MVRWVRLALVATLILALLGLGVIAGLFLVVNGGWIEVAVPPWLSGLFGSAPIEVWLPALLGGWILSALLSGLVLIWSMHHVWRRRQVEALIGQLEGELADLRNMALDDPAPLEDLPERPDPDAGELLERVSREIAPEEP